MNDPARVQLSKAEQDALVVANLGLVHFFARKIGGALDYDDKVAEGNIGLVRAANDYDSTRGAKFGTYASFWIRAFIFAAVARHQGSTRNTKNAALYMGLRKLMSECEASGWVPSDEHVGEKLGVTAEAVTALKAHILLGEVRIDWLPVNSDARFNMVVRETPEDYAIAKNSHVTDAASIRIAMRGLLAKEREVIRRRHLTEDPETLNAIGEDWGVSRERVRQIETKAMGKLKRRLVELGKAKL